MAMLAVTTAAALLKNPDSFGLKESGLGISGWISRRFLFDRFHDLGKHLGVVLGDVGKNFAVQFNTGLF